MSWNRQRGQLEPLMVGVLKRRRSLTLAQIVDEIKVADPKAFVGKTPRNSLYSIVVRNEKRRLERGERQLFKTDKKDGWVYYSLRGRAESK